MDKAIFVSVRTGSSRLPNKSILKIKDKYTIEYVISSVKKSKYADGGQTKKQSNFLLGALSFLTGVLIGRNIKITVTPCSIFNVLLFSLDILPK